MLHTYQLFIFYSQSYLLVQEHSALSNIELQTVFSKVLHRPLRRIEKMAAEAATAVGSDLGICGEMLKGISETLLDANGTLYGVFEYLRELVSTIAV